MYLCKYLHIHWHRYVLMYSCLNACVYYECVYMHEYYRYTYEIHTNITPISVSSQTIHCMRMYYS